MKCNHCNQMIPEKLVKEKRRKMGEAYSDTWNMYCNDTCFKAARAVSKKPCVQCGDPSPLGKGPWIGRELCKPCSSSKVMRHLTNDEIIYLVTNNPGVGFKYFVKETNPRASSYIVMMERLRLFLEEMGSYEGVDYVEWLESPKMMRKVLQDEVPPELLWSIIGERRSVVSNQMKRVRIREGLPTNKRNSYYVNIPPLFKWGKLDGLKETIFGE